MIQISLLAVLFFCLAASTASIKSKKFTFLLERFVIFPFSERNSGTFKCPGRKTTVRPTTAIPDSTTARRETTARSTNAASEPTTTRQETTVRSTTVTPESTTARQETTVRLTTAAPEPTTAR